MLTIPSHGWFIGFTHLSDSTCPITVSSVAPFVQNGPDLSCKFCATQTSPSGCLWNEQEQHVDVVWCSLLIMSSYVFSKVFCKQYEISSFLMWFINSVTYRHIDGFSCDLPLTKRSWPFPLRIWLMPSTSGFRIPWHRSMVCMADRKFHEDR